MSYIREIRISYPEMLIANGSSLSDAQNIADGFNHFFVNLGPNLAEKVYLKVFRGIRQAL